MADATDDTSMGGYASREQSSTKGVQMSELPLTREERHHDVSGTPHGLMGLADDQGNLLWMDDLPPELEENILVEYPVGSEFIRHREYRRFVRFRKLVNGKQYALVKTGKPT